MPPLSQAVSKLERELRGIFGTRLQSLVAYGTRGGHAGEVEHAAEGGHIREPRLTHTMAIVEKLTVDDLRTCSERVASWHDAGLATPLLLASHEFECSLDAFPLEFGAILADHVLVTGQSPFDGLAVNRDDLRRACEVQARSHLLHLREGYLETRGRGDALAVLVVRSAAPFAALLEAVSRLQDSDVVDAGTAGRHVERMLGLEGGPVGDVVKLANVTEISSAEAAQIFPAYLDAVERLVAWIDSWGAG
jgi:hypothetical protein